MRKVLVVTVLVVALVLTILPVAVAAAPLTDPASGGTSPPPGTIDLNSLFGLAGVPLVMAMVGAVKRIWPELEERWYPIVSILCGEGFNLGLAWILQYDWRVAIVLGLIVGLAASGLYSGSKAVQGS